MAGIGFLGYVKVLDGPVLAALFTGIVASLFVKPEKKE
jgi:hypothetical protein